MKVYKPPVDPLPCVYGQLRLDKALTAYITDDIGMLATAANYVDVGILPDYPPVMAAQNYKFITACNYWRNTLKRMKAEAEASNGD